MPFIYLTDAGRDLPAPVQERVGTCLEHGLHCLVQTVGVHAVAGVEEFGVRDRDEVVRAAAADQLAGDACLRDARADQLAETAEQVVVLRRNLVFQGQACLPLFGLVFGSVSREPAPGRRPEPAPPTPPPAS